jgi:hypothetical protein
MDWTKGFSASYIAMKVNPSTWEDEGEILITGGKIDRDIESALIESANIETTEDLGELWIRLYLVAKQGDGAERIPLFTGLTSSPTRSLSGYNPSFSVDCFSVLTPCADRMLPRGWFAPKDGNGAAIIADLLGIAGAEVETFEGGGTLTGAIVAESGETYLSMAHKVADAIGWQIRIDGRGKIHVEPYPDNPSVRFNDDNDVIQPNIKDTRDWYSCPNVLRVTYESYAAIARDDDPESPLSTVNRGREIWAEEAAQLSSSAPLAAYAQQRLKELQKPARKLEYVRRFMPNLRPGDLVSMNYPEIDIEGDFRIDSQSLTLGYGCDTEEVVHGN